MRSFSGKPLDEISLEAVLAGEVHPDDLRIHPEALAHQAEVAQAHANPQLAANLLRAAELAALDDADVMCIYEALRPRRSTADELDELASWLAARGAVLNSALVREARQAYVRRGLCR